MTTPAFRLTLIDIRQRRDFDLSAPLTSLATLGAVVNPETPIQVVGTLEAIDGGRLTVKGRVRTHWFGECRRCLGDAEGNIDVAVSEVFEPDATEGETYPISGEFVDLEPLVREAVMLELPTAPVCRKDCPGLCPICGINRDAEACQCEANNTDPRWAALDKLRDDDQ